MYHMHVDQLQPSMMFNLMIVIDKEYCKIKSLISMAQTNDLKIIVTWLETLYLSIKIN